MARSVWKGPFVEESLIKKVEKIKNDPNKKPIKTWSRKSTIIPDFVGFSFLIYNGKKFIPITVSEDMVGHKFGEFAPTRQFFGHTPADKKNIKIGKAGRSRWLGIRPHTRGVVKNPVDHPHGGGEGKSAGGRHPVSPTGQSAKGLKTRDNKRTDKFIIRRRKKRGK